MKRCLLFLVLALLVVGCSKSKRRSVSSGYTGENSAALSPEMLLPEEVIRADMNINSADNNFVFNGTLHVINYDGREWEVTYSGNITYTYRALGEEETLSEAICGSFTASPAGGGLILQSKESERSRGLEFGAVTIILSGGEETERIYTVNSGEVVLHLANGDSYKLTTQFKGATITLNQFLE